MKRLTVGFKDFLFLMCVLVFVVLTGCKDKKVTYAEDATIIDKHENENYKGVVLNTTLGYLYLYNNEDIEEGPAKLILYNTGEIAICTDSGCRTVNNF